MSIDRDEIARIVAEVVDAVDAAGPDVARRAVDAAAGAQSSEEGAGAAGRRSAEGEAATETAAAILAGPVTPSSGPVGVGADHGGFALKEILKRYLADELGYTVRDYGTHAEEPCDYPDTASAVARGVAGGECVCGIVINGAGIGSAMAANRVPGVLAANCHDVSTAINSRQHNGANVLVLGSGVVGRGLARQIARVWLGTRFGGGRHERRVRKILALEG